MDLAHWIERHARFAPGAVAIRFDGREIAYARLAQSVARAAGALAARGVRRGDAVAYLGLNHPAALALLFACEEACVVGRPEPRWGEVVAAAVVLKPGCRMTEAEAMALFQGRVARYKHLREVRFLERLPRSALGKIQKEAVRAVLENR